MKAATGERIWTWSARLAPCLGLLIFLAFGWESMPPWYSPAGRVWRLDRGAAPLEAFVDRTEERPADAGEVDRETTAAAVGRSPIEEIATDDAIGPVAQKTDAAAEGQTLFWLNLRSGVRHNAECRYFDPSSEGRYCGADEGRACRICGG